jgi:hypothetical protein
MVHRPPLTPHPPHPTQPPPGLPPPHDTLRPRTKRSKVREDRRLGLRRRGPASRGDVNTGALDQILALQLTIAWAGEARCEPRRLGWWSTDVIDAAGGGDLWARLTPRTAAWAGLEAAREAARRTDERLRQQLSDPDRLRTLYFLGFEHDEHLAERLAALKKSGVPPARALGLSIEGRLDRDQLAATLTRGVDGAHTVVPGGRQLKGAVPEAPEVLAARLAAALVPWFDSYPLPYARVRG